MKLKKLKISMLTIVSICLLLITGIIFYYEEIKEDSYEIESVSVVVATKDIKENTIITPELVRMENRYKVDISKQTDTILTYNEALGKRTKVPLYQGEVVSKNRVIEDKPWMGDNDKNQISLNLVENDKAIDLKGGDYIDIWIEPMVSVNEDQTKLEACKIFEKLIVIKVLDANYLNKTTDEFVPSFITIQLKDEELKELLEVDKNKFGIRITKYGEDKFYKVVDNISKDN